MTIRREKSYLLSYFKDELSLASYFKLARDLNLIRDLRSIKDFRSINSFSSRCLSDDSVFYNNSY